MPSDGRRLELSLAVEIAQVFGECLRADIFGRADVLCLEVIHEVIEVACVRIDGGACESGFDSDVGQEVTNRSLKAGWGSHVR